MRESGQDTIEGPEKTIRVKVGTHERDDELLRMNNKIYFKI